MSATRGIEPGSAGAERARAERWLSALRPLAGGTLNAAIALAALAGLLMVVQVALLAQALGGVMFAAMTPAVALALLAGAAVALCARALCLSAAGRLAAASAVRVQGALRDRLYRHLFSLGLPALAAAEGEALRGARLGQLQSGIEALAPHFAGYLPAKAQAAFLPLAVLFVVFPQAWQAGLVLVVTAPVIPLFMVLIGGRAEAISRAHWREYTRLGGYFLDLLQALGQLRLLDASRRELDAVRDNAERWRRQTMDVLKVAFLSSLVLEFMAALGVALVAVLIGFALYWGRLDFSTGLLVLLLAPAFYQPLRELGSHHHARMASVAAAQDMQALLERAPAADGRLALSAAQARSALLLRGLRLRHRSGRMGLDGLDLDYPARGLYAIAGRSGAGKSTLLRAIAGLLPIDSGEVRFGAGGPALAALARAQWWAELGWVGQAPVLFAGSLADNVCLGRPAAPGQLDRAAGEAGLAPLLAALPAGWAHRIGDGGEGLSGGQRQRVALARALFEQPSTLLLDEPSAGLDADSERAIADSLQRLAAQRRVIVVAHHLSTLRRATRIDVLADGRVVEQGEHAALLRAGGHYSALLGAGARGPAPAGGAGR